MDTGYIPQKRMGNYRKSSHLYSYTYVEFRYKSLHARALFKTIKHIERKHMKEHLLLVKSNDYSLFLYPFVALSEGSFINYLYSKYYSIIYVSMWFNVKSVHFNV